MRFSINIPKHWRLRRCQDVAVAAGSQAGALGRANRLGSRCAQTSSPVLRGSMNAADRCGAGDFPDQARHAGHPGRPAAPQPPARQVATWSPSAAGGRPLVWAWADRSRTNSTALGTNPIVLAERLDEGLDLLQRYWSGEPVNHHGRHYHVREVTLLPATAQPPVLRYGSADSSRTADRCIEPPAGTARCRCSPPPGMACSTC